MDQKGDLSENFKNDVKGMLSLYEASFLALEGEDFLLKAQKKTITYLKNFQINSELSDIMESIDHALELPLYRRMVMLEAGWCTEVYNKREHINCILLELAKLQFNMTQSILQRDLKDMSRYDYKLNQI